MTPLLCALYYQDYITALLLFLCLLLVFSDRKRKEKNTKQEKKERLLDPQKNFALSVKKLFFSSTKSIDETIPALEEILLGADVGITATERLLNTAMTKTNLKTKQDFFYFLKNEIANILTPKTTFAINSDNKPYVIYLAGVNGSGKTTTIGKLACQFKSEGHKVMLVAADTFRAAAVDQLRIWAEKNDVAFIGGRTGADPSSVIVDGLRSAKAKNIDIVLVDTAGRLQTKTNLMNELKKMVRMSEKEINRAPDQIFLVVDAITGQNGFSQAKIYLEAIPLTGIILTKFDATAKGGIIISIVEQTGLPIRYVGLGEKINDLKPFNPD
ncbi:signal recognition particle-docking protein FtsY, partial [bacterium]|nr:signal recognition particle-docking protein FtsY [bacterium]